MGYSNGFMRKSSSGKWVGVLKYRDACGQWRQVTKTFARDRAASEGEFALWRKAMGEGAANEGAACPESSPITSAPSPTVEEAVRACLAAQLARGRIERSTHFMQLGCAERALFPELGPLPLAALTPATAQAWVDGLCLEMSAGSARVAFSVLSKACGRAAAEGLIAGNPLLSVEAPARKRPGRAYLPEHAVELLERSMDARWGTGDWRTCGSRLALYAGLRVGEACALRWDGVDLASGRLSVSASIGRSADGSYLKDPKCAASNRSFPIVGALAASLEARRSAGDRGACTPECFVCGCGTRFAEPRSLSTAFARLCEREGIADSDGRRATFHTLRHTFATRAVQAGVDVRTLADLMGHARADVTLNVYAASGEDAKLAAIARMDAAFEPHSQSGQPKQIGAVACK